MSNQPINIGEYNWMYLDVVSFSRFSVETVFEARQKPLHSLPLWDSWVGFMAIYSRQFYNEEQIFFIHMV